MRRSFARLLIVRDENDRGVLRGIVHIIAERTVGIVSARDQVANGIGIAAGMLDLAGEWFAVIEFSVERHQVAARKSRYEEAT
ncbi:MAG: hypothetical protein JNL58_32725 [Planctomyces sp.]|nr:hypothetical protein [Planctomyces sp.]